MNRRELIFGTLLAPVVAPFAALMTKPALNTATFTLENQVTANWVIWDDHYRLYDTGTGPEDYAARRRAEMREWAIYYGEDPDMWENLWT